MIVVTGGAGFIGSAFVWKLNKENIDDILVVDDLGKSEKWQNLVNLKFNDYLDKEAFLELVLKQNKSLKKVKAIVHMGACSSTTEDDMNYLIKNNYLYIRKCF